MGFSIIPIITFFYYIPGLIWVTILSGILNINSARKQLLFAIGLWSATFTLNIIVYLIHEPILNYHLLYTAITVHFILMFDAWIKPDQNSRYYFKLIIIFILLIIPAYYKEYKTLDLNAYKFPPQSKALLEKGQKITFHKTLPLGKPVDGYFQTDSNSYRMVQIFNLTEETAKIIQQATQSPKWTRGLQGDMDQAFYDLTGKIEFDQNTRCDNLWTSAGQKFCHALQNKGNLFHHTRSFGGDYQVRISILNPKTLEYIYADTYQW